RGPGTCTEDSAIRRTSRTAHRWRDPPVPGDFARRQRWGSVVEDLPIGRRVAYWRQRRKMSQQVFADRLGKSKSWVDKIERGARRLDKFSVLYEIAEVLQV